MQPPPRMTAPQDEMLKIRVYILPLLIIAALLLGGEAAAGPKEKFLKEISDATKVRDSGKKRRALEALFYFKGVDQQTREQFSLKVIDQVLMKYVDPVLDITPLPEGFDGLNVKDGAEYRPNLPLLGLVVLNGLTRLAYGEANGRLFFAASTRTVVNPHAAKDIDLSILVIGSVSPERVKFKGQCRILLSTNKEQVLDVDDQGLGSYSLTVPGQKINACEIIRSSPRGKIQLILSEGEREVFKSEFSETDQPVTFLRDAR